MSQSLRPLIGAGLAIGAGLCFSSGGFFVRSVSVDGWEIITLRCLFAGIAVLIFLLVTERRRLRAALKEAAMPSVWIGLCTGWAIIAYVLAMQLTLVANVISIMATSTVIVAGLAWPLLGERAPLRTWLAMAGSLAGIGVMFWSAAGAGGIWGNLLAFSIALAISAQTLIARRYRNVQMAPAVLIAATIAGLVSLPLALPFDATTREVLIIAAFGVVQLALALMLYFYAARYIPAPTLIFVVVIDAVFGSTWVWLGHDEVPGTLALIGAGVIIACVTTNGVLGLRALRAAPG